MQRLQRSMPMYLNRALPLPVTSLLLMKSARGVRSNCTGTVPFSCQ